MDSMETYPQNTTTAKERCKIEDLKVSTGQHSESLYAIEVRLTADGILGLTLNYSR